VRRPRFRIQITFTGWLFIFLCLAVGAAGLNTGNNLLYLVFGMMLSFIILSGILSNNTLSFLEVAPRFPSRIFARDSVPVRMEIENRKRRFPSFSLSLYPQSNWVEACDRAFVLKLPAGGSTSATHHIRFPSRGRVHFPLYRVETSYPFGLIKKYITVPSEGETIVYPALLPVDSWIAADHRMHGEHLSGQKGESANPYGIRDFVYGDPARIIHWKSSAKSGGWKVKEFEREKRMKVVVDVRLAEASHSETEFREKAISVAASLVTLLPTRGFEIGLRLNGKSIEGEGRSYVDAYLTALALVSPPITDDSRFPSPEESETTLFVSDLPSALLPRTGLMTIAREKLEEGG
jgi:uncharacterized protein (DUF58 family)